MNRVVSSLLITSLYLSSMILSPSLTHAAIETWQKGATINPTQSATEFAEASFKQSVTNLAATGANYVTLMIPYYQPNVSSSDLHARYNTPTDAALVSGISFAHSKGLKVMLKPHLDVSTGEWRATIDATNRASWFASYGDMLVHFAQIGQQQGVEEMCLGTELYRMASIKYNPSNEGNWNTLISRVKGVFSGKLTYSAQYEGPFSEKGEVNFWSQLDSIGLSAYWSFSDMQFGTLEGLTGAWDSINKTQILPLSQKFQKPVLFTEIGYRSVTGAHREPWADTSDGSRLANFDEGEQARLYEALFSYWTTQSFMEGVHFWNWDVNPGAGGAGNITYTPQNKQAQQTMKKWFSNPLPQTYSATVAANPATVSVGQTITLSSTVQANVALTDTIIDTEIYNGSQRVFQKFQEHQNLMANTPVTVTSQWTPATSGHYQIKVGLFSAGWSSNYIWQDAALFVDVTSTPTPTPLPSPTPTPVPVPSSTPGPVTSHVEIWWPSNGATVSGVQPFKAILSGMDVGNYSMYWQVDGGTLHLMGNSFVNYPHKESLVNLAGWTWRGTGPYTVTFVAKDTLGTVVSQASTSITVKP